MQQPIDLCTATAAAVVVPALGPLYALASNDTSSDRSRPHSRRLSQYPPVSTEGTAVAATKGEQAFHRGVKGVVGGVPSGRVKGVANPPSLTRRGGRSPLLVLGARPNIHVSQTPAKPHLRQLGAQAVQQHKPWCLRHQWLATAALLRAWGHRGAILQDLARVRGSILLGKSHRVLG